MAEREVRVPKVLCHSDGAAIFCNWHPDKAVYAVYLSDQDTPPAPKSLNITTDTQGVTNLETLVWKPVIQTVQTGEPGEVEVIGPYDLETGEGV
jgi:hypothetical protein